MRALALLGALAVAAAPVRAGDLGGRIVLSWQSYTSGDLESDGLHQLYDLRLNQAVTDTLHLRFTFRGEDDGSGSTLLGERRTSDARQVQPGFRLLYSVGALQLQGDWDRLSSRFSNSDGPDSDRTQDRLRVRLTYRPENLPGLTVEGTRRRGLDVANALDLTETRSTVRLDYAWRGIQAAAAHQTFDFEDAAAGYDRRSRELQGNLGYSGNFWGDRVSVQANAFTSRGRIDLRALGGGPTEVPNPVAVAVARQSIDDTPEDGRDRPPAVNPLLIDGDFVHAAGAPLGPDAPAFLNLVYDFGRFAQVDELRVVARDPSGNPLLTGGPVSWDLYDSRDGVLWEPVTSGVSNRFDAGDSYWSVRFPRRTTRYLKVVSFFVDTVPAEVTEILAFFTTQLVPGGALAGDQTLTSGSGTVSYRPQRTVTLTWTGLINDSELSPDLSQESSTRDRDQRLSALWQPVRWGNLELQRQWRRASSTIGGESLDQDLDAWTGIARLTANRNLVSTFQYDHTEEDVVGGTVRTDRYYLHTLARFWETLEINFDVGRESQDDLASGYSIDSPTVAASVRARLTRTLQWTATASRQENRLSGTLPPGTVLRSDDDRWWSELFWQPSGQLGLGVRLGRATGGGRSGTLQSYRFQWQPFPYGALRLGATYDQDLDPALDRRSRRLILTPSWTINRHMILNFNYSLLSSSLGDTSADTETYFVALTTTF
jgi:hypothetical protein